MLFIKNCIKNLHNSPKSCTFVADFKNHDLKNTVYASQEI